MRDYLNGILSFIGSSSLTDEEFEGIDAENQAEHLEVYNALLNVLDGREGLSNAVMRLKYYFLAKGISFAQDGDNPMRKKSNIFLGGAV